MCSINNHIGHYNVYFWCLLLGEKTENRTIKFHIGTIVVRFAVHNEQADGFGFYKKTTISMTYIVFLN